MDIGPPRRSSAPGWSLKTRQTDARLKTLGHRGPEPRGRAAAATAGEEQRGDGPHPCVGVEALQEGPAPVLVLGVPGQAVQIEQALRRLGPQQVVPVGWLGAQAP